jgi:negative regulator of flagellin synthesis FlgM
MTNEINGFRLRTLETPDSRAGKDTAKTRAADAGASPAAGPSAPTDSVSLTDSHDRLKELAALLAGTPEVDSSRVEELRKQIAEGRYQPDDVHVAEKLVALEQSLFGMDRH